MLAVTWDILWGPQDSVLANAFCLWNLYACIAFLQWVHDGPPKQVDNGLLNGSRGSLGNFDVDKEDVWFNVFKNNELQTFEWNVCGSIGKLFGGGEAARLFSFLLRFRHFARRFWNQTWNPERFNFTKVSLYIKSEIRVIESIVYYLSVLWDYTILA